MPDPASLRDSTEIRLHCESLDGLREDLNRKFTVTVFSTGERCRIIGSPVEIKAVSDFLARHGINMA